jgi:PKD repeat protein
MNKLFTISGILLIAVLFSGCIVDNRMPDYPNPSACFITSQDSYAVNERIYFNNCSDNADSFDWEFGDGYVSNEKHPSHKYDKAGNYQVRLTAYGYNTRDSYTKIVTVEGVTELDILVLYLGSEDPVSNCNVSLYDTESDWQNFENSLMSATTGTNGTVLFSNLDTKQYFIDGYKEVSDTSYYSNELQGYSTDILEENQTNYYNIYVELLYTGKSDRKTAVIKKIEKGDPNDPRRVISD